MTTEDAPRLKGIGKFVGVGREGSRLVSLKSGGIGCLPIDQEFAVGTIKKLLSYSVRKLAMYRAEQKIPREYLRAGQFVVSCVPHPESKIVAKALVGKSFAPQRMRQVDATLGKVYYECSSALPRPWRYPSPNGVAASHQKTRSAIQTIRILSTMLPSYLAQAGRRKPVNGEVCVHLQA